MSKYGLRGLASLSLGAGIAAAAIPPHNPLIDVIAGMLIMLNVYGVLFVWAETR